MNRVEINKENLLANADKLFSSNMYHVWYSTRANDYLIQPIGFYGSDSQIKRIIDFNNLNNYTFKQSGRNATH